MRWPRNSLYPQKLALTSPTSDGRSVSIVRLRTKATDFFFSFSSLSPIFAKYGGFLPNRFQFLQSEVFTAMFMGSSTFRDTMPCSPLKVNRLFEGMCHLHLQGRRISRARNKRESMRQFPSCFSETSVHFQRTARRCIPEIIELVKSF
jgi:hypothetical protein